MIKKTILLSLVMFVCLSLTIRQQHQTGEEHEFWRTLFKGWPANPRNRTKQEVCVYYGGNLCKVALFREACCNVQKCGTFVKCPGKQIDLKKVDWNYEQLQKRNTRMQI